MHLPEYVAWGERTYGTLPIPIHRRNRWEFQIIHQGNAGPSFPGVLPQILPSPRLYGFSPEALHGWTAPDESTSRVSVIHFRTLPQPIFQILGTSLWKSLSLSAEDSATIEDQIRSIVEASKTSSSLPYLFRANEVLWAIGRIFLELSNPEPDGDKAFLVRRTSAWLEEHMHENPGIDDVCKALYVSKSTLHRAFQATSELTPMQTLYKLRITRAKSLLTATTLPISEIAYNLGYPGPGDFSRAFHRAEGSSPGEYRKHYSGGH